MRRADDAIAQGELIEGERGEEARRFAGPSLLEIRGDYRDKASKIQPDRGALPDRRVIVAIAGQ